MTSLDSALAHVDASTFTLQADGTPLPQTSAPGIITALLRLLDVRPGDRVLEIGTGSGYTTAVLASLVGDSGHVTSIDVNPTLTARARALIDAASVVLVSSDGAYGHPPAAPLTPGHRQGHAHGHPEGLDGPDPPRRPDRHSSQDRSRGLGQSHGRGQRS